jgi:hypothetical protein
VPGCLPVCRCRGHPRGRRRRFASLNRGRASARSAGSIGDLVEGNGPPDFGFQALGMGAAAGISGHGARRRRADADRVGSRPGGRRRPLCPRFAAMTSRMPWVSAQAGAVAAVCRPGRCVTPLCSVAAGERTPPPGLRGPRCPPAASASAAGAAGLRARPGSRGISSWRVPCRSQARRLPASAGPRRQAARGQSSAGCQSTGGGSEPCLMMLAYTPSSASLSGPTRPSGSPPKNRRRTRSTCPGAASS